MQLVGYHGTLKENANNIIRTKNMNMMKLVNIG